MTPTQLNLFRRFPDTIIRRRFEASDYDEFGDWIESAQNEVTLRASVQPILLEDRDLVGGAQMVERLKVYVPADSGDLRAAFDDREADRVVYKGKVYMVEGSRTWPKFTRATLLRET